MPIKLTIKQYEKFIGLVLYCVSKHSRTTICDHWDMLNSGILGLAEALKTYNGKCPLKYWVYRVVNSSIIKCRYRNGKEIKETSGYDEIMKNTLQATETSNPLYPIYEAEDDTIKKEKVKQIMDILNSDIPILRKNKSLNKKIYLDKIYNNLSIDILAKKYSMSYSAVNHRVSKVNILIKRIIKEGDVYESEYSECSSSSSSSSSY